MKLTANTKRAINNYGAEKCREAFNIHHVDGEGDGTVAAYMNCTRAQANAMINAGRELAINQEKTK